MRETRNRETMAKRKMTLQLLGMILLFVLAGRAQGQQFENIPPLNFTMPFGGGNPLPQIVRVASTGTNFNFTATATTTSGGNWLTTSPGPGCCSVTPEGETVIVTAGTLAAGSYSGQVVFKSQDGTKTVTVPVTLTVESASSTFFDSMPGELSFSTKTGAATTPPAQTIPIRNAGAGTLNWTLTASTADGGNWLTVSAATGTAPSQVTVGITPSKLPNGGAVSGTFDGQLLFSGGGDSVTVPVSVTVDPNAMVQLSPLYFTMPFGGGNPLPQVLEVASTGTNFNFTATAYTSQGGSWLTTVPGAGCCSTTPAVETVIVANAGTLAAGSYSGEVVFRSQDGSKGVTVPITLTVESASATFFDSVPGELSFSMKTNGTAPPGQAIPIRNAGSGSLSWTLTTSTADGGNWLTASATAGTAPSLVTIGITPSLLPNGGVIAGTFNGQLRFHTSGDDVTVPVSVTVDANAFVQLNPISFTMPFGGGNPLPQVLEVASTGTNFNFTATAFTSQGGSWLSTVPGPGCCSTTPAVETVIVSAGSLAAGSYSGEVTFRSQDGTKGVTVPVTLTVESASATFFDSVPGEMSFSMKTGGGAPPAQTIQIRNAGKGKMKWTLQTSTADGGTWLTATPTQGTAPKTVSVGILPADLPGQGLISGTFNGQLLFNAGGDVVTVPVSVTVDANPFEQINPINFTMPFGGANPLPQLVLVASAGANFNFTATASTSQGGNWLTTNPGPGCCSTTSNATFVNVVNAGALAVGTYTGQVTFRSQDGTKGVTVPVTLAVESSSKAFFDNMPGGTSFFFTPASSGNPGVQAVPVLNGGTGTLNWTVKTTTADGGKWLKVTPTKGAAPGVGTVSVIRTKLPNKGKIAGSFVGQEVFQTASGNVTVPVSVSVGDSVFVALGAVTFTAKVGSNPASQTVTVASTGSNFNYTATAVSSKGGAWLSVTPGGGCCSVTPTVETINVKSSTLGVGTYVGQITFRSQDGTQPMTIPIILSVTANAEEVPGESQP